MSTEAGWNEDTSRTYLDLADVAIPDRREQLDVLLSLVPATDSPFTVVDICCGDGSISYAVLDRFPSARLIALDGSGTMLQKARARLEPFADRADVRAFDFPDLRWVESLPADIRCAISSIAVHHLDSDNKRALFQAVAPRIQPGGAFLVADIVAPASDLVRRSHREFWGRAAREQSLELTGSEELYRRAVDEGWGYYDEAEHDPLDQPSPLFDQLLWLRDAGFSAVDCFWLRGGFAVFGGYR